MADSVDNIRNEKFNRKLQIRHKMRDKEDFEFNLPDTLSYNLSKNHDLSKYKKKLLQWMINLQLFQNKVNKK